MNANCTVYVKIIIKHLCICDVTSDEKKKYKGKKNTKEMFSRNI